MTVTVEGPSLDSTGRADSRDWTAFSPVYREGGDGGVITTKPRLVRVVAGVFKERFEPGPLVLVNPDGTKYTVTVPDDETANLWELIAAAEAFPPDTAQEALAAAVTTFLDENPVATMQVDGLTDAGTPGKNALKASTQAQARAAIGAGTSNLTLGSTGSTAKPGNWVPATADISDATASGKTVVSGTPTQGRNAVQALGLVQAAKNPDLLVTGAITLDSNDLIASAAVAWPDGTPGTLTITSRDANNAVLAYNITYGSPVTKTFTQPTITRNANGAATIVPAIVES